MPTGTTPPPHGQSLDASMEQLQISKPLRSGAQAQQQQETLWMQQQEMLQMQIQQEIHSVPKRRGGGGWGVQ